MKDEGLEKTDGKLEELAADYRAKFEAHAEQQEKSMKAMHEMQDAEWQLLSYVRGDVVNRNLCAGQIYPHFAHQADPIPTRLDRLNEATAKEAALKEAMQETGKDAKPEEDLPDQVEEPLSRAEEIVSELRQNASDAGQDDEVLTEPDFAGESKAEVNDPDFGDRDADADDDCMPEGFPNS